MVLTRLRSVAPLSGNALQASELVVPADDGADRLQRVLRVLGRQLVDPPLDERLAEAVVLVLDHPAVAVGARDQPAGGVVLKQPAGAQLVGLADEAAGGALSVSSTVLRTTWSTRLRICSWSMRITSGTLASFVSCSTFVMGSPRCGVTMVLQTLRYQP